MIEMRFQLKQVVILHGGREGRITRRRLVEVECGLYDVDHIEYYTVEIPGPTREIYETGEEALQPVEATGPACEEELALAEAIEKRPIIFTGGLLPLMVKNICDAVAAGYDWRLVI